MSSIFRSVLAALFLFPLAAFGAEQFTLDCVPKALGGAAEDWGFGMNMQGPWAWVLCKGKTQMPYAVDVWSSGITLAKLGSRAETIRTAADPAKAMSNAYNRYVLYPGTDQRYAGVTSDMCAQMAKQVGIWRKSVCQPASVPVAAAARLR